MGLESLWPGPWDWALYEVRDLKTARECQAMGARYVETMAVRGLSHRLRGEPATVVSGPAPGLILALDQGGHGSRAVLFDRHGNEVAVVARAGRDASRRRRIRRAGPARTRRFARARRPGCLRVARRPRAGRSRPPASPPSAPRRVLGTLERSRAHQRDLLAGPAQRRVARAPATAGGGDPPADRARALAALRRQQAALVPGPRARRASRRGPRRPRVRAPVELPAEPPARGAPAGRGPGERVAHAALRPRDARLVADAARLVRHRPAVPSRLRADPPRLRSPARGRAEHPGHGLHRRPVGGGIRIRRARRAAGAGQRRHRGVRAARGARPTCRCPDGLLRSVLRSGDAGTLYSHEGTVNGAGSAVDWLRGRVARSTSSARSATLAVQPGDDVPLFMNGVGGLGAPYWLPGVPGRIRRRRGRHAAARGRDRERRVPAARQPRRDAPGGDLQAARISGGMARCDYLCQALADLGGLAVRRHALGEATARGAAYLAAGEPREWMDRPVERSFEPRPNEPLAPRRRRWLAEMARRGAAAP